MANCASVHNDHGAQATAVVLIRRCLAGDENAFAALFHQYKNLVFKTAFVVLGNVDEANDCLQDVFLEVHKSLRSYQPNRGAFTTWLYRITVNDCLSQRRKRRFRLLSFNEIEVRTEVSLHQQLNHTDHAEAAANVDAVLNAMRHLSPKLRAVVALRYYRDLTYAEIATILSLPIGTVKSRLSQAMEVLRHQLENETAHSVAHNLLPAAKAGGQP
jgi:RNA polymerase sigma-70 factor (ECF subfamily)